MTSTRTRWRILLAAGSLVTMGAATGVAVDRSGHLSGISRHLTFSQIHQNPLAVIEGAVDLRPEQRERISEILDAHQPEVDRAWREAQASIQATLHGVIAEIMEVLDPEQRDQFHQLATELHGPDHVPPPGGHLPGHVPPVGAPHHP
jgi:Spy/CpxP family protein refolding chaperone